MNYKSQTITWLDKGNIHCPVLRGIKEKDSFIHQWLKMVDQPQQHEQSQQHEQNNDEISASSSSVLSGSSSSSVVTSFRTKAFEYKLELKKICDEFFQKYIKDNQVTETREAALKDELDVFTKKVELALYKLRGVMKHCKMKRRYVNIQFEQEKLNNFSFKCKLEYLLATFDNYIENNFNLNNVKKELGDLLFEIDTLCYDINVFVETF